MLAKRLRRWPSIDPALRQHSVLLGFMLFEVVGYSPVPNRREFGIKAPAGFLYFY